MIAGRPKDLETDMLRKTLAAVVALTAITGFALPATAETRTEQVAVSYHDLDLTTESGAEQMLVRIERAAERACSALYPGRLSLTERRERRRCAQEALEVAVATLNAPMVLARYQEQTTGRG